MKKLEREEKQLHLGEKSKRCYCWAERLTVRAAELRTAKARRRRNSFSVTEFCD